MKRVLASLMSFCLFTSTPVSATEDTYSLGDVTMDKSVNVLDLLLTKKMCLGLKEVTDNRLTLGDFNNDKIINAQDLLQLKRILLGKDEAPEQVFLLDPLLIEGNQECLQWSGDFNIDKGVEMLYSQEGYTLGAQFLPESNLITATLTKEQDEKYLAFSQVDSDYCCVARTNQGSKVYEITNDCLRFTDYSTNETGYCLSLPKDVGDCPRVVIESEELGQQTMNLSQSFSTGKGNSFVYSKDYCVADAMSYNYVCEKAPNSKGLKLTTTDLVWWSDKTVEFEVDGADSCIVEVFGYTFCLGLEEDGELIVGKSFVNDEGILTILGISEYSAECTSINSVLNGNDTLSIVKENDKTLRLRVSRSENDYVEIQLPTGLYTVNSVIINYETGELGYTGRAIYKDDHEGSVVLSATLTNSRKGVLLDEWKSIIEYDDNKNYSTPTLRESTTLSSYSVNSEVTDNSTKVTISNGGNKIVTLGDSFGVSTIETDTSVVSADYVNSTATMITGTNSCLLSLQPMEIQLTLEDEKQSFAYDRLR